MLTRVRLAFVFCLTTSGLDAAGTPVSFSKEIKPILEARCIKCHGGAMQLAKLDLRTREAALKGGEKGPSIVPGKPELSPLYKRAAGTEKPAMPMDGKLSAAEVDLLKRWIEQDAKWDEKIEAAPVDASSMEDMQIPDAARKYWAFQKPGRVVVPAGAEHPVDAFLRKTLADRGLKPAPPAPKSTLVRRAYLDLLGLPPTPEETRAFLNDKSPRAWENLIEKLLASPHYGERWGRHWLDVARYADSNGYEHDFDRPNAWRYRDYVIQSFNRDTPYNVFLAEQIAGDELDWVTEDTLIATAFLRNYAKVGFREKDNPQFRYDYLDDMIATLGRGVMAMTVQCARCHNHKFDPIPQKDYYKFQAALFGYVEVDHPLVPREQAELYRRQVSAVDAKLAPLRDQIRELERPYKNVLLKQKYKKYPENIQQAINTPEAQRTPGQVLLANQITRTVSVSSGEIGRIMKPEELTLRNKLTSEMSATEKTRPKPVPVAMGITDGDYRFSPDGAGDEPAPGKGIKRELTEGSFLHTGPGAYKVPPSYFLHHGDVNSPGSVMQPGFLTVATYGNPPTALPPPSGNTSGRRRALAEWLGSTENPLTARVIVNRIWNHHFGQGIVATLDNFGKMGEPPTHPELLDWLAVEFMKRGWSIKEMHRLLMTSEAYKMSSQFADDTNIAKDAANLYLWRFRQQRLEAEIVRDNVLAVSGALNAKMGGPAVFPKLPEEVLDSMKKGIWKMQPEGPETWRRSVYVYRKRGLPFPFFEVFDLPDQNLTCGRRNVSTVPTQALTLLNNEFIYEHAKRFAGRVRALSADKREQVSLAYELALSRPPTEEERKLGLNFLETNSLEDFSNVLFNLSEFVYIR
jgi:hypothetical protein